MTAGGLYWRVLLRVRALARAGVDDAHHALRIAHHKHVAVDRVKRNRVAHGVVLDDAQTHAGVRVPQPHRAIQPHGRQRIVSGRPAKVEDAARVPRKHSQRARVGECGTHRQGSIHRGEAQEVGRVVCKLDCRDGVGVAGKNMVHAREGVRLLNSTPAKTSTYGGVCYSRVKAV